MGGRSSSRGHRILSRSSARAARLGGALFLRGIRGRGIGLLAQRMLPEPLLIRVSFLHEAGPQIDRLTMLTCRLPFCFPPGARHRSLAPRSARCQSKAHVVAGRPSNRGLDALRFADCTGPK
jgi:hypothetical protein